MSKRIRHAAHLTIEVNMPIVQPGLTIKSLAEVAWFLSRVGRRMIDVQAEPAPESLREFWQSTRQLQMSWDEALQRDSMLDQSGYEELLPRLLTTDLLSRVWGTVLGGIDQRTGRNDYTRIVTNIVGGLLQIRNRLLSTLLTDATLPSDWIAEQDRLRRRCDRWTDLLIGNLCGHDEFFQFAIDPERARDFAEESRGDSPRQPVELLITAGVRLSFLGHLPEVSLDSPAYEQMIQSILCCIPEDVFEQNGLFMSSGQRPEDVLVPGVTMKSLRKRFS